MAELYLAEIVAYDASTSATVTLRYGTRGFTTGPAETPANTPYDYRLKQPVDVVRDCFSSGTTSGRSRTGYGDLVLLNPDGGLDALADYGFDGRAVTIRHATKDAPAYPGDFTTVFVGTMEQALIGVDTITLRLRDRQYETAVPLQATKYAGSNVLPTGLEGTADDLEGKPKPVCLGTVSNISPPCVNTSKLIYQVHDGAVADITAVYDQGLPLFSDVWDLPTSNNTSLYAVTSDGAGTLVTVGAYPCTSTDAGATWTQRTWSVGGMSAARCVAYGAGLFVAGGYDGAAACLETSPTGVTWTKRTNPFSVAGYVDGICWDGTRFVAVRGNEIATSTNGTSWTLQTWSGTVTGWLGVAAGGVPGNARLVAVGTGGTLATSDNGGVTWVERTSSFATTNIADVCYGRGLWVAVGYSGKVATSTDGISWTCRDVGFGTDTVYAVAYGAGRFVVAGAGNITATSFDGAVWQKRTNTWTSLVIGLTYTEGAFIGVGQAEVAINQVWSTAYTSTTELQDDSLAPKPGQVGVYLAGGYFRLGAPPAGLITADVTQGAAAANRTAAQLYHTVLETYGGIATGDIDATDLTDLDTANSAELGFWTDQETTVAEVCDQLAGSVGAWWGCDQLGVFRIQQFAAPVAGTTPTATFTANDVARGSLQRLPTLDTGNGLPAYQVTVRWGRNYTVQVGDLAGGVTDVRRAFVAKEWREAVATDASTQTMHTQAVALVEDSLLTTAADAQAEADRRLALRGERRDRYELTTILDAATAALDLGDTVTLQYARWDLTDGRLFRIIGIAPDAMARLVRFTLWGPNHSDDLVTDTGVYFATDTGVTLITGEG